MEIKADLELARRIVNRDINDFWLTLLATDRDDVDMWWSMRWKAQRFYPEPPDDLQVREYYPIDQTPDGQVIEQSIFEHVLGPHNVHSLLGGRLSRVLRPHTDDPSKIPYRPGGHGKKRRHVPIAVKRRIQARDECCQMCGSEEKLEFDHILPRTYGGAGYEWNLWLLCHECNQRKGSYLYVPALSLAIDRLEKDVDES